MGERRWLVIASDGRHTTLGRMTDPTPAELETVERGLRDLGLAGWLVVSEGRYYGPGPLDLMLVRPLVEMPGTAWEAACTAFTTIRERIR